MRKFQLAMGLLSVVLVMGFQNCGGKNFIAAPDSSTGSSSVLGGGLETDPPITQIGPNVGSTSAVTCVSYTTKGDTSTSQSSADAAGHVDVVQATVGTVIYQSIACNTRPISVGYQATYCNAPFMGCGGCLGGPGNYVCGADGNWAAR